MQVYGFDYNNIFFLLSVEAVEPVKFAGNLDANTCSTTFNTSKDGTDLTINGFYTYQLYDQATCPNFGNPYLPPPNSAVFTTSFPDWISTLNTKLDLRGFYLKTNADCPTYNAATMPLGVYCQALSWPANVLSTVSTITNHPVAFTTESIFYAQSGYFVTIVMVQWSNVFACKSRKVLLPQLRSLSPFPL